MLRARIGEHARRIGKRGTATAHFVFEIFTIEARIASRRDLGPTEILATHHLIDVRLAKGNIGALKSRIRLTREKHGNGSIGRKHELVPSGSLDERLRCWLRELSIAPDRETGRHGQGK